MLRQVIRKLLGTEVVTITIAEVSDLLEDPCCRHIETSSPAVYAIFGRDCIPGELVRNAATTPETAAIEYCRI